MGSKRDYMVMDLAEFYVNRVTLEEARGIIFDHYYDVFKRCNFFELEEKYQAIFNETQGE